MLLWLQYKRGCDYYNVNNQNQIAFICGSPAEGAKIKNTRDNIVFIVTVFIKQQLLQQTAVSCLPTVFKQNLLTKL